MQQILPRTRSGAIKPPTFGIPKPGANSPYCKPLPNLGGKVADLEKADFLSFLEQQRALFT
jgi:hypothetical protein